MLSFLVFFLSFVCCLSLVSNDSKLMEKIIHRSTVFYCQMMSQ